MQRSMLLRQPAPAASSSHAGCSTSSTRHTRPRPCRLRRSRLVVVARSSKSSSGGGKDGKDEGEGQAAKPAPRGEQQKADFSAYWSAKVRSLFSARRAYLESAEEGKGKEPESLRRLNEAIEQQREQVAQQREAQRQASLAQAATDLEADQQADARARALLAPLAALMFPGKAAPEVKMLAPEDQAEQDIQRARAYLHTPQVKNVAMTVHRASKLLRDTLMLPFTLCAMAWKAWHDTFKSQKYEMFLMAEGERIWFWRNRTENERWFWDIFAWDRLIFPILCTVAYQYIVPNHLLWVVVVPMVFIMWQTGRIPGPLDLEFWLIMYFGVYKKCWADVVGVARALFLWA